MDELNWLERKGPYPISVIVIDVNGLKAMNDKLGHLAGDGLLRRMGEVLTMAVAEPVHACRIGGDEFVILMPDTDERAGEAMIDQLTGLLHLNNQFYSSVPLQISVGLATAEAHERLEHAIRRADARMYEAKRLHYATATAHVETASA